MSEVHIDRLTLKLSGWTAGAARKLAEQMVAALEPLADDDDLPETIESLRAQLRGTPGDRTTRLAEQSAQRIIREAKRG